MPDGFLALGTESIARHPGPDDHRRWSCSSSSATTCTPRAAAASSTRSAPTPTPPSSTACRSRRRVLARVRRSAARWPAWPACSSPPATAPSARSAGLRHRAAGRRRRGHRRRRDLRRQRHRLGRRHRRVPAGHHQPRPADPRHPGLLAARRRRRADPRRDRARPGARRSGRHARLVEARDGSMTAATDAHAPRRTLPGLRAARCGGALLLTREIGGHRAARRWSSSTRIGNVPNFDGPLTLHVPAPRHRADPADRAADDADHHHRRDRPVGGQRRRA